MKVKYKIYIYDNKAKATYPIVVEKEDFFELCEWLNGYRQLFNVNILRAEVQDYKGRKLSDVHFLTSELEWQYFYTSKTIRLLEYHEQLQREDRRILL